LWISLAAVLLDQASKILVAGTMSLGSSTRVIGDFFRLTYIHNPNAAFSLFLGGSTVHLVGSAVAMLFILAVLWRSQTEPALPRAALALILGGAIGNGIDRVRLKEVIDFLDVEFFNVEVHFWKIHFDLQRWPVFNVADAAVVIGAILLAAYYLLPRKARSVHGETNCTVGT
jgi:signal peptidase II